MIPDIVLAAREVGELIEAHADESERTRRQRPKVVKALAQAGLMRMCVPAAYGGPEVDPITMVRAIESLAYADGAAGWCSMIASTTSSLSLFLEPEWARKIYGDPTTITGGVFASNGTAERVEGGWTASGRWMWGSGTQHCRYIVGGVETDDDGFHVMIFDAADVLIHDTWHTSGLRGTGSNDFSVDGAFVPFGRSTKPLSGRRQVECALAAFPNFTLLSMGVAAVTLGIARRAIDEFVELAVDKHPQFSKRTISQIGSVQTELARCEAAHRSARAFLLDEVGQAWETAVAGGLVDVASRGRMRLAGTNAAEAATRVVDSVYTMGGGASVFESNLLQRCLRDVHVATQHIMVAPRLYEKLGKMFFGADVDAAML